MNTFFTAKFVVVVYFTLTVADVTNSNAPTPYQDRECLSTVHQLLEDIEFDSQQECLRVMCAPKPKRQRPAFPITSFYIKPPWLNSDRSAYVALAKEALNELKGVLPGQSNIVTDDRNNAIGVFPQESQDSYNDDYNQPFSSNIYNTYLGHFGGGFGGVKDYDSSSQNYNVRPAPPNNVDSSVCCKTVEHYFINFTMTDISGIARTLAQFEHTGSFQIVRHGVCGAKGVCPGTCSQVYVTTQLAIFPNDPGQVVTYRYFNIPGYCTCKVQA
ncbi:uncharacterized protein LOC106052322 [Biomphalaria glabrata]|uniref:Uncharacterized protein LOC106052322 n=1 Tax=Biomphalaria glabrata TaxID=6526 RepID=A0A9U8DVG4_BIOGL|nr:uncharacterized protein LOC106052322 [Biomphalaria glabrata]XP_013063139.2 uncharacterized protein LOC106052322 [Biomphalaria glabrata]XP_013063140.2 uncharacterized protein LOC106052322 [Biomphalaria glabrata]KAI8777667.1 hypothetical protein BgiBS90_021870 [Biomphalaria glabrata]